MKAQQLKSFVGTRQAAIAASGAVRAVRLAVNARGGQRRPSAQCSALPSGGLPRQRTAPSSLYGRSGHRCAAATAGDGSLSAPQPARALKTADFLRLVVPTALALALCNMDRICLSLAIMPMAADYGWSVSTQGVIQSAFLWGYMATQLLGGTLADLLGGKAVMAFGIAWFSLASAALPLALSPAIVNAGYSVAAMLAARCAVGLGEGVALPAMNNLVATYVPPAAKARALGFCFSGFQAGNLLGLLISPFLLVTFGWRSLFYVYGIIGLPLLAMWLAVVPSKSTIAEPTAPGSSSPARLPPLSPLALLGHRATWGIIIANVVNHWGYFIYLNWMPTYFVKALGFDLRASSFLAFLPWLVMAVGSSAAGLLADGLIARGLPVVTVRKGIQTFAFLLPAAALLALTQPGLSPQAAVALMTAALGTTSLGQAGFVANMSDIAPKRAGMMFGLCNTFGSLSGILGVTAVGYIVEATKSFATVFQITAGLYVLGSAAFLLLATSDKLFD